MCTGLWGKNPVSKRLEIYWYRQRKYVIFYVFHWSKNPFSHSCFQAIRNMPSEKYQTSGEMEVWIEYPKGNCECEEKMLFL